MPGTAGLCLARTRSLGLREGEELAPEAANLPKSPAGELLGGVTLQHGKGGTGPTPLPSSAGPCSRRLGCAASPHGAAGGCSRRRLGHARLSRWMLIHAAALAKPAAAQPHTLLTREQLSGRAERCLPLPRSFPVCPSQREAVGPPNPGHRVLGVLAPLPPLLWALWCPGLGIRERRILGRGEAWAGCCGL